MLIAMPFTRFADDAAMLSPPLADSALMIYTFIILRLLYFDYFILMLSFDGAAFSAIHYFRRCHYFTTSALPATPLFSLFSPRQD